jgi:hypothetical protein
MKNLLLFVAFLLATFVGHVNAWWLLVVSVVATVGYLFSYGVFRPSKNMATVVTGITCASVGMLMFLPYFLMSPSDFARVFAMVGIEWFGIGLFSHMVRSMANSGIEAIAAAQRTPRRRTVRQSVYVLD